MVAAEKRVLVVDDEEIVRESYKRALTEAGYTVRAVESGRDALKACRAEPYDVMLADLKMPDMDGLEVTRAVTKEFPEVRVVIITGYPSRNTAEQAAKLGIFDYLEKPLSPEGLSAATAEALTRPARCVAATAPMPTPEIDSMEPGDAAPARAEEAEPSVAAEKDMGTLQGLALLAAAPLIGLAFVVFLPLIGFAVLFSVLGSGLADKLGWARA